MNKEEKEIKELLETDARQAGLKLEARFTDENILPRAPIPPGISHRFSGAVKIPRGWLDLLTTREFESFWFHEVAHVKFHTFPKLVGFFVLLFTPISILYHWFDENLIHFLLLVVSGAAALLLTFRFQRRFELAADRYAKEKTDATTFKRVLQKIDKWCKEEKVLGRIARFHTRLTHPSLSKRIEALERK